MVIEIQLNDGEHVERKLYRGVHIHNLSAYVAGFFANKPNYKWGIMTKIVGKKRDVLHAFGKQ